MLNIELAAPTKFMTIKRIDWGNAAFLLNYYPPSLIVGQLLAVLKYIQEEGGLKVVVQLVFMEK